MSTSQTVNRSNPIRVAVLALSAVLIAASALPANAGIDKNPNAFAFGPSVCEDGRQFEVSWTPTDPAPVGLNLDSNEMGLPNGWR